MDFLAQNLPVVWFHDPVEGLVTQTIADTQPGRCQAMGSTWPARCHHTLVNQYLPPHTRVSVVARQGLCLIVQPLPSSGHAQQP